MGSLPARYIHRAAWGARPPKSPPVVLLPSAVDTIVYHYTAALSDTRDKHDECAVRVRGVQAFHQEGRGWNDIAYNFLVCKHGYIFEGRGIDAKSAATGADNSHTLAVCFLGADRDGRDDLTAAGRQALVEVTRWVRQRRPVARYLKGHRDFMSTSCPGGEIHSYIRSATFAKQVEFDDAKRLAALRKWILARHAEGWGWKRIKASPNWREFVRRGGK
jgi:hypothetical protein